MSWTSGQLLIATGAQTSKSSGTPRVQSSSGSSVLSSDFAILLAFNSGTITLPQASTVPGMIVFIQNNSTHSSNNIAPFAGDTILGNGQGTLSSAGDSKMLLSDGNSQWCVMSAITA